MGGASPLQARTSPFDRLRTALRYAASPLLRVRRSGGLLRMKKVLRAGAANAPQVLFPWGAVVKSSRCGKTTVIPAKAGIHFTIFAFVFAFNSDSREGAARPNPGMRSIYMAAAVSSPAGREDVRAKGQRQRRKWIPAFAGMTNKTRTPLVVTAPPRGCPTGRDLSLRRSRLLAMLFKSEVRNRVGGGQFRARKGFSTTPEAAG